MSPISTWKTTRNRGSVCDSVFRDLTRNPHSYNNYLQEVEDIPFNLINEIDIPKMRRNEAYAQALKGQEEAECCERQLRVEELRRAKEERDACEDFFARQDALDRHRRSRPEACLDFNSKPAMALLKRRVTEIVHGMFMERLEHCLKTNEDIGVPFSQIIVMIFPESSKRGSRQQSRLTAGTSQPP
ncbi:hypothetical protein BC826DRAFT_1107070 [Russula brevipes]|nr:hypothetical protein BC826DRAFT_1107070 [Russula brevipes]